MPTNKTYRIQTTIPNNKTLTIKELPFRAGAKVEVIVRQQARKRKRDERYPLHGKPLRYTDPFKSVAEDEWDALK